MLPLMAFGGGVISGGMPIGILSVSLELAAADSSAFIGIGVWFASLNPDAGIEQEKLY